jgi:hypothetical protein
MIGQIIEGFAGASSIRSHTYPRGLRQGHRMKVRRWLKENIRQVISTEEDWGVPDKCAAPATRPFAEAKRYDLGRPLIFMHVPKCSGTSLIHALVAAGVARSAFSGFDGTLFGDFAAFESFSAQLRLSIHLNPYDLPKRTQFVAAHMSLSTLSRGFPGGQLLTLLREPVSRLLSLWLFWRSHTDEQLQDWGQWGDRVRNSRRPLVEFLSTREIACQTDNQLLRMLLWPHPLIPREDFIDDRHDTALVQAATERLMRFSFLDLVENQAFESNLANWLGRSITFGRFNQTANIPQSLKVPMADQLTDEAWALLEARSRLELKLWLALAAERVPQINARLLRREAMAKAIRRHSQLMAC